TKWWWQSIARGLAPVDCPRITPAAARAARPVSSSLRVTTFEVSMTRNYSGNAAARGDHSGSNSAVPGGLPASNNPALRPLGRIVADSWKCLSEFAVPTGAARIELRERTALSEIRDRGTWRRWHGLCRI